jgi:hypothetical protein
MQEVMYRYRKFLITAVFIVAGNVGTATAHHSFAMFDRKVVGEVSGTVKEVQWTNPHVYLEVDSRDDQGITTWTFEAAAPLQLEGAGLKRTAIKAGDKITVRMHPLKNGAPGGEIVSVKTEDGKVYALDKTAPPEAAKDKK